VEAYCPERINVFGLRKYPGGITRGKCPRKLLRKNVKIPIKDYKSLPVAGMICGSQANTETHL